jgi:hypothetical protein
MRNNCVRLFKCPSEWSYEDLTKFIDVKMKELKSGDDPSVTFNEAEYLDPSKIELLEDCRIEPN